MFSFIFDLSIFAQRSIWEINLFSIICAFSAIFDPLGRKVKNQSKGEKKSQRIQNVLLSYFPLQNEKEK